MNKQEIEERIKETSGYVETYKAILKGHEDNLAELQSELVKCEVIKAEDCKTLLHGGL